jgi:hypothetical protein
MTEPARDDEVRLAPDDDREDATYHRDFHSWSMAQARHLRAGRRNALDRDNLAEEIEALGREQFYKLESALRVLMLHMLKWDHQPDRRGRSWSVTIREQRLRIDDLLSDNPSLRPRTDEAITRAYRRARLLAVKETDLEEGRFPEVCPYSWSELASREFPI